MKNSIQPSILLSILFLTAYAQSAVITLEEKVDDFSDEVSYTLQFSDDSQSSIMGVQCSNTTYVFLIMPKGMWESSSSVDVKFRFDKNEPFSTSMSVSSYKSAYTRSKSRISEILSKIKSADSFITKVGSETVQKFSGITPSDIKTINRFIELSSNIPKCV